MSVCVDGYNRVWVGSNGNGLDLYDRKNDRFVSVLNDYFRNGDVVFSMLEDDEHTLWLTTNAEIKPETRTFSFTGVYSNLSSHPFY